MKKSTIIIPEGSGSPLKKPAGYFLKNIWLEKIFYQKTINKTIYNNIINFIICKIYNKYKIEMSVWQI